MHADRLEECLDRIERRDDSLGAVVHIDADGARRAAAASDARRCAGRRLSAIDGMPIAVKANIAVAGWPWTAGIAAYRGRLAPADARCVARLRAAGAVLLGLTKLDEGALGAAADNPWLGRTHNPHAHDFSAGGSSGGSAAAVAAGFCDVALGTDTIGSVRIPAAYCGVIGHKPAHGAIPLDGVVPLSTTLDHVGVLAGSVADCRAVAQIAAQADFGSDATLAGKRVAVLDAGSIAPLQPAVAAAFAQVVERSRAAGARLTITALPEFPFARMQRLLLALAEIDGAVVHAEALRDRPEGFSPRLTAMLAWGAANGPARREKVRAEIGTVARETRRALVGFDALLLPATPDVAFGFDTPPPDHQAIFMTLGSCLGLPATVFPIADGTGGLPVSAQIVAKDDALCLALAAELSGN